MKFTAFARVVLTTLAATVQTACVVPVPPLGAAHEVTEQSIAEIKPGISTRADVLLLLADPPIRGEEDRYFVYFWERTRGGVLVIFYMPIFSAVARSCHWLALAFAPDGVVAKLRMFHGDAQLNPASDFCSADSPLKTQLETWLAEPAQDGK